MFETGKHSAFHISALKCQPKTWLEKVVEGSDSNHRVVHRRIFRWVMDTKQNAAGLSLHVLFSLRCWIFSTGEVSVPLGLLVGCSEWHALLRWITKVRPKHS